ncbi:PREDICTED: uncharacterized protein LOC108557564 [Nicrophorus vespilloides]|uniref:Uncharacterized protein LOC108557564 n=1 Tax=Nicrophorus vespilloides TaxID=110193 RepID=A0ABM1M4W6_NICVS|nr:PREDICTED: uncharacterized protein LOC108557564 [Nicrophorus vespilloides]XP_017769616.1 PREDICTED: uncharacterized protein LOC108557564 [Nicrophorus vespilloides]
MRQSVVLVAVGLAVLASLASARTLEKRDTYDANLDPALQEIDSDDNVRDKRHQDVKFGVKNAILGFVFNKINSFIDQKTHWVDQLDRTNIAKNRQHGIEAPKDPVTSLSSVISGAIGKKLEAAGPLIGVAVQTLTSGSGGLSGGGHGGFNIGSLLGGLSGGGGAAATGGEAHAEVSAYAG